MNEDEAKAPKKSKKWIWVVIFVLLVAFACSPKKKDEQVGQDNAQAETSAETEENTSTETDSTQVTSPLQDLQIGQAADFPAYTIIINSVAPEGYESLKVNITMNAKQDSTFKAHYLEAYHDGEKMSKGDGATQDVKAGESFTTDVTFANEDINKLRWNNWSNEATWVFTPVVNPEAPDPNTVFNDTIALAAIDNYGQSLYPYGFKLHSIAGVERREEISPDEWEFAILCDVTNEYGAKAKNLQCIARVKGIGTNLANYEVTYFEVR